MSCLQCVIERSEIKPLTRREREPQSCTHAAGLVTSLTGRVADSVLGCASWTGQAPSSDILGRCAAVDEKAAALLSERDQALLTATAALLVGTLHLPSHAALSQELD